MRTSNKPKPEPPHSAGNSAGRSTTSVLPLFFSHSNWTSFLRQLTNYGFERGSVPEPVTAATDGFVFTHAVFRRGRPDALPRVVRVRKRGRRSVEPTPDAPVRAAEAPTPPTPSTHAGAASDARTSISKRTRAGPTASLSASDTLSATAAMPILAALGSPAPLEPLLSGQTSEPNAPTSAAATLPQRSTFDVTDGASVHTIWSEIVSIRAELHSLRAGQQELLHALHQHSSCRNMQSLSSAGSTLAMDLFDQDSDALFGSAL